MRKALPGLAIAIPIGRSGEGPRAICAGSGGPFNTQIRGATPKILHLARVNCDTDCFPKDRLSGKGGAKEPSL